MAASTQQSGERGSWGSEMGFLLAAVGSAVGLGNMWRFSATASSSGGAAFVVLYIALTFIVGIPLLMSELAIGRRSKLSPVGALRKVAGPGWVPLGWLFVAAGFIIFSFYGVIAGWAVRYGIEAVLSGLPADPAAHFNDIASGMPAALYHIGFTALTVGVVMAGVKGGIERASMILMPTLFGILILMAIWAFTLDGSGAGYEYFLSPDWGQMFHPNNIADAAGQTYFSLSLGMGALITFASYLGKKNNLPKESGIIAFADFAVAFMAGLVVFPVVFALGFDNLVIGLGANQAEGVLFIALPAAFQAMGSFGRIVGVLFFFGLSVAALTSTISLLEVVVSSVIDEFDVSRKKASILIGAGIAIVGIAPAYKISILGQMNSIAGELFLGIGAFLTVIIVGWVMDDPVAELEEGCSGFLAKSLPLWRFVVKFILPLITGAVLVIMIQTKFFSG
jgi:neurotransmitter:Na+ symporter, NSS family